MLTICGWLFGYRSVISSADILGIRI